MGTVKGEQMEEEVVTVEHAWQVAKMLEEGMKLTSDEFAIPHEQYCYYDESFENPFRFIGLCKVSKPMNDIWSIKTWRKVKPQFKKYDVVECEPIGAKNISYICVWGETNIMDENGEDETINISYSFEPYTGPVPKHIQDFIDEMKAKEK